jgi:hypothetical protein
LLADRRGVDAGGASWAVVARADQAINPDQERFMAERVGAETIEVDASHAVMVVEPRVVTEQIRAALQGVAAAVVA